ncbi:MAG: SAM-dependent methyltransferase, partial [Promethearchaeota archaeon]
CSGDSFLFFLDNVIHKAFLDIANLPLTQYRGSRLYHPVTADLTHLPFRNQSFDLISALDVLEHIKNDEKAISEMSRILKLGGIVVLTVPHRMKYYSKQDQIIGHYRRYELDQIYSLFKKYNLYEKRTFGVYGQFMRIADIQSFNPEKTEKNLLKHRTRYLKNPIFQKIWNMVVKISSKFMKVDAKYHSLRRIMNIGLILSKK